MSLLQLLDRTVTIRRKTRVSDGMGGFKESWTDVGTSAARISPVSAKDRIQYEQLQYPVTHKVYLPGTADIRAGDQIVLGSRLFAVQGKTNPSEEGHHFEVLCEELTS